MVPHSEKEQLTKQTDFMSPEKPRARSLREMEQEARRRALQQSLG
jgi:hypothetical protein